MNRTALALMLWTALIGCASSETREQKALRLLDDERLEALDTRLRRWSKAKSASDLVLEEMLRRDLRRESSRLLEALQIGLSSDDDERRAICAAAIGFSEDVGSVPLLVTLLDDDQEMVRANALLSLCLIRSSRTPIQIVQTRLQDPSPRVRRLAVFCLGDLWSPETGDLIYPAIVKALGDPDESVRVNASHVIGRANDVRAMPMLTKVALVDKAARVRLNAAVALGQWKMPESAMALAKALKSEMNRAVRREIAAALKAITGLDHGEDAEAWVEAVENAQPEGPADEIK